MKNARKLLLALCVVFLLLTASAAVVFFRPVSDGRSPEERHRIAEACLGMLRSSLTNEADIQVNDARIPEAIRALHPISIELSGGDAVVMCPGKPVEYHLSQSPKKPETWILYVAGPGYWGHREISRIVTN